MHINMDGNRINNMRILFFVILSLWFSCLHSSINPSIISRILFDEDESIVVIASGQSNAGGRGDGGPFLVDANVLVWNNQNNLDDLSVIGDSFITPERGKPPFIKNHNNIFINACSIIARETGKKVKLLIVTKGGSSIYRWSNGAMYRRLKEVYRASGLRSADIFMWQQGENDSAHGDSYYTDEWNKLSLNMLGDFIVNKDTVFMLGQVSSRLQPNVNPAISKIQSKNVLVLKTSDLSVFDGVHFDGESLFRAGAIYAEAYLRKGQ